MRQGDQWRPLSQSNTEAGGAPYTEEKHTPTWKSTPSHVITKDKCKTCVLKGNIKHSIYEHHNLESSASSYTLRNAPLEDALDYTRAQVEERAWGPQMSGALRTKETAAPARLAPWAPV